MRGRTFLGRCTKEILRDPLTLIFGIGFPVILLILLSVMNKNIPAETNMFAIEHLLPGVAVFGFSFLALFTGLLLSTDRDTAFLMRLFTSPLSAADFLMGYALPLIPIGIVQTVICLLVGLCFGLTPSIHFLTLILFLLPPLILFIGIGLLVGSLLNSKQVGSVCGALLTNLSAWLSGIWFSLDLLGKGFKSFAYLLPFANAVDMARYALAGDFTEIWKPFFIVLFYTALIFLLAIFTFRKKMKQ